VLGFAEVVFMVDKRKGKEHRRAVRLLARPPAAGHPIDWEHAEAVAESLAAGPEPNASWESVPEALDTGRKLKALERAFTDFLYSTEKLSLFENRSLELVSEPGESAASFRDRCRLAAVREAEQALQMEKVKFTPRFEALGAELPGEHEENPGGSWLDWLNPFASAPPRPKKKASGAAKQEDKLRKLQADYQAKKNEIVEKWKRVGAEITPVQVKPRKADVRVTHFGLVWLPEWC
jgi:hypothetical protein